MWTGIAPPAGTGGWLNPPSRNVSLIMVDGVQARVVLVVEVVVDVVVVVAVTKQEHAEEILDALLEHRVA